MANSVGGLQHPFYLSALVTEYQFLAGHIATQLKDYISQSSFQLGVAIRLTSGR